VQCTVAANINRFKTCLSSKSIELASQSSSEPRWALSHLDCLMKVSENFFCQMESLLFVFSETHIRKFMKLCRFLCHSCPRTQSQICFTILPSLDVYDSVVKITTKTFVQKIFQPGELIVLPHMHTAQGIGLG
jgi:hypothetical protein